jgi:hypothetical protein
VHPILVTELAHDRHVGLRPDRRHPVPVREPWRERREVARAHRLQRRLVRAERRALVLRQQLDALAQACRAGTTSRSNSSIPLVS